MRKVKVIRHVWWRCLRSLHWWRHHRSKIPSSKHVIGLGWRSDKINNGSMHPWMKEDKGETKLSIFAVYDPRPEITFLPIDKRRRTNRYSLCYRLPDCLFSLPRFSCLHNIHYARRLIAEDFEKGMLSIHIADSTSFRIISRESKCFDLRNRVEKLLLILLFFHNSSYHLSKNIRSRK